MNTGDGGKLGICGGISGYGTTLSGIFDENMNGMPYCGVFTTRISTVDVHGAK